MLRIGMLPPLMAQRSCTLSLIAICATCPRSAATRSPGYPAQLGNLYETDRAALCFGYWLNIGVAFPHENGDGFNVMLQALPLHGNGKLVLRAYDPEQHAAEERTSRRTSKRKSNAAG